MRFWQHTVVMGVGLFLFTLTSAMAEDTPPPQTQNEGEVQSRGLLSTKPQLPLSVQFNFQMSGVGRIDVITPNERFSCPPTCTRTFRGGTSLQMKGTSTDSFFQFKEWQHCTGQIQGSLCSMSVPTNSLTASVLAVFSNPIYEQLQEQTKAFCQSLPQLCKSCEDQHGVQNLTCIQNLMNQNQP